MKECIYDKYPLHIIKNSSTETSHSVVYIHLNLHVSFLKAFTVLNHSQRSANSVSLAEGFVKQTLGGGLLAVRPTATRTIILQEMPGSSHQKHSLLPPESGDMIY
jgi:hypothetical protein